MQPLMNMITFTARSRGRIIKLHNAIADALQGQDADGADENLAALASYTQKLAQDVIAERDARAADRS